MNKRIIVSPVGTWGDVFPALLLARALLDRGHTVTVLAPPDFEQACRDLALPFFAIGSRFDAFMRVMDNHPLSALPALRALITGLFADFERVAPPADIIIGGSACAPGRSFAEKAGARFYSLVMSNALVESAHYGAPILPWRGQSSLINRASWWAQRAAFNLTQKRSLNRERAHLGLGPVADVWEHFFACDMLLAADPVLFPVPDDAATFRQGSVVACGAFVDDRAADLPAHVETFLRDNGPPVIFIGFGSMVTKSPERTSAIIDEAVMLAGCRAVVQGGNSKSPAICAVGSLAHHMLFPRVRLAIHHGGAGTTTTAARAGIPQVIVPHLLDQFVSAQRVHALGVGPKGLARQGLSATRLAAAIRHVLADEAMLQRARALRLAIKSDGIAQAVRLIEVV